MAEANRESSGSSSEKVTIAYTESVLTSEEEDSSESMSSFSTLSSSLETPTSEESATSVLAALDVLRQTEDYFGYIPVTTDAGPKMEALQYFWEHSIFQLFTFMMTHLLANTPEDPADFLKFLVDRCINYRDGLDDQAPLVFEDSHIRSVYTALDPLDNGSITYKQYVNGMTTLGLTEFNVMPNELYSHRKDVSKETFLQEAKRALVAQLEKWLGKPASEPTLLSEDDGNLSEEFEESFNSNKKQLDVEGDQFNVDDESVQKQEDDSVKPLEMKTTPPETVPTESKPTEPVPIIRIPLYKSPRKPFANFESMASLKS